MNNAIGWIEVKGLAAAIDVSDIMVKSANVELRGIEKAKGFGWMTVAIEGDVGAVKAAVDAGKSGAVSKDVYVASLVIPRPAVNLTETFLTKKTVVPTEDPVEDVEIDSVDSISKEEQKLKESIADKSEEEAVEKVIEQPNLEEKRANKKSTKKNTKK